MTHNRAAGRQKPWRWAVGSGIACGVLVWALTHYAQANARKRVTVQGASPQSAMGPLASEFVGSNNVAAAETPVAAGAMPATDENPTVGAQQRPPTAPVSIALASLVAASKKDDTEAADASRLHADAATAQSSAGASNIAAEGTSGIESRAPAMATESAAKATALQLLQKGNAHVSARSKNRVLEIVSGRASVDDLPRSWRIVYHDEKTTYNAVEVRFESGEMERVHEPNRFFNLFTPGSSKTLDLAKVKVDSDEAVRIAVKECDTDEIKTKSVELKLERGYGGLPVWNVKLFGSAPGRTSEDASLGSVILLAEDGKVLKKESVTKAERPVPRR